MVSSRHAQLNTCSLTDRLATYYVTDIRYRRMSCNGTVLSTSDYAGPSSCKINFPFVARHLIFIVFTQKARPLWVAFVRDCELFSEPYPCTQQESACVKPGSTPSQNSTQPAKAEGESKRKAKAEGEAEVRKGGLSFLRAGPCTPQDFT